MMVIQKCKHRRLPCFSRKMLQHTNNFVANAGCNISSVGSGVFLNLTWRDAEIFGKTLGKIGWAAVTYPICYFRNCANSVLEELIGVF